MLPGVWLFAVVQLFSYLCQHCPDVSSVPSKLYHHHQLKDLSVALHCKYFREQGQNGVGTKRGVCIEDGRMKLTVVAPPPISYLPSLPLVYLDLYQPKQNRGGMGPGRGGTGRCLFCCILPPPPSSSKDWHRASQVCAREEDECPLLWSRRPQLACIHHGIHQQSFEVPAPKDCCSFRIGPYSPAPVGLGPTWE